MNSHRVLLSVGWPSCSEGAQAHHRIERNHQVRILTLVAHFKRILMKLYREDDTNWPKKNIVGKQELEIRVGNDHIAFEVCLLLSLKNYFRVLNIAYRLRKLVLSSMCKIARILKVSVYSTISSKTSRCAFPSLSLLAWLNAPLSSTVLDLLSHLPALQDQAYIRFLSVL